jgi:hypothetical protein
MQRIMSAIFACIITISCALLCLYTANAAETEIAGASLGGNCVVYTLCNAQAANGTCGGSGNERFIRPQAARIFTAIASYAQTGGADGWTVKLYNAKRGSGYEATQRTLINSLYDISVATTLTYSFAGPMGDIHAVVAGLSNDTVTITIHACQ